MQNDKSNRPTSFYLLNARSIRNKSTFIKEFVTESDIDILAITETWLQGDCYDYISRDVTATNYIFRHVDRGSRGGGVGLLYKKGFAFKPKP